MSVSAWTFKGVYQCPLSFSLLLGLFLASFLGEFLIEVAQFVSETVGVHCISIVELVSSASDILELESRFLVEVGDPFHGT